MSATPPADTFTYATGGDTAQVVLLPLPRAEVAAWLPRGISLATPPCMGGQTHPVLLLYSAMKRVGVHPIPTWLFHLTYLELGIGVPYCSVEEGNLGYTGPAFYTGLFHVQDRTALFLGNLQGSLPKYRATLHKGIDHFEVRQWRNDHVLASLDWTRQGETSAETRAKVLDAMCQPLVTRKPRANGGAITWYGMRWGMDEVPMHDIDARGSLASCRVHEELRSADQAFAVPGARDEAAGIAVEATFQWHLNGPVTDGAQLPLYRP